jgi:hypothetical protein
MNSIHGECERIEVTRRVFSLLFLGFLCLFLDFEKFCWHSKNKPQFKIRRFNYRATQYLLGREGLYDFLNWFDERAW